MANFRAMSPEIRSPRNADSPPTAAAKADDTVGSHEAARILGCTVNTVKRWSREGGLPVAITTPAGARRYDRGALRMIAVKRGKKSKNASAATALLHAAIFDCFKRRASLEDIVCELEVPAPVVLELWELYRQGVPYDGPKPTAREKAKAARDAAEALARADERAEKAFEQECREKQERLEREHQAHLALLRGDRF